ncbi:complex I NDUFA9 subunit family protein [Stappia sp. F7233]|uniref:Complex I NDUFA9 subunit family protein n=1 Tax=Stappia albiluteola TaxID=2758565 RepID=A0A839AG62_9HYPH|nr:complex I NDUFA9 subunit family protein [Stappia albiluteola]MBA5777539.1 complex I NDUFA9 subunit family protein [Stappia albiluteola]
MKHITVFGGTGFLGRRIVAQMLKRDFTVTVAARHPRRDDPSLSPKAGMRFAKVDIRDQKAVEDAIRGAYGVVNAVSLYVERGDLTFRSIHVEGAQGLAKSARRAGVDRLVHISGIGTERGSPSAYVRARAEGEEAVRDAFPRAALIRPSVMFGEADAFLNTLFSLTKWLPMIPLFGNGETRLQPVYAGDVAQAVAEVMASPAGPEPVYELGGPDVLTYRDILREVLQCTGRRRLLLPVPMTIWDMLAAAVSVLPSPPITEGQVALMKADNVARARYPGFEELGIRPKSLASFMNV